MSVTLNSSRLLGISATMTLAVCLVVPGGVASAQPLLGGFGGAPYGYGSTQIVFPGSTPEGDLTRGLGVMYSGLGILYNGLGQYNYDLSLARAINAETDMVVGAYLTESRLALRRQAAARVAARRARNQARREEQTRRVTTMPNERDIMSGDALNRIVEDLTGYRVPPSLLRAEAIPINLDLPVPLEVETVRAIPYQYPSVGGILSLPRMLPKDEDWPLALRGQALEYPRRTYTEAVQHALLRAKLGQLTLEDIRAIQSAIEGLRKAMVRTQGQTEQTAFYQAQVFLKQLEVSAKTLQSGAASVAIAQLDGFRAPTVFELVSFMQRYNLRFAMARTPEERQLYRHLYQLLAEQKLALGELFGDEVWDLDDPTVEPYDEGADVGF